MIKVLSMGKEYIALKDIKGSRIGKHGEFCDVNIKQGNIIVFAGPTFSNPKFSFKDIDKYREGNDYKFYKFFINRKTAFKYLEKNEKSLTMGMVLAREGKGHNIPVLDYDGRVGKRDVKRLMEEFKLGPAVRVKSKNGNHYLFFHDNERSWKEIVKIINSSKCDKDYKEFSRVGWKVLRIGRKYDEPDLKIVERIKSEYPGKGDKSVGDFLYNAYKHSLKYLGDWGIKVKGK